MQNGLLKILMLFALQWKVFKWQLPTPIGNRKHQWGWRETIGVRLEDDHGRVGFGEIASLPGYGGERLQDALTFLRELGDSMDAELLPGLSQNLPATAFGLSTAIARIAAPASKFQLFNTAFLGDVQHAAALLGPAKNAGFTHFKIKLGVAAVAREIQWIQELIPMLPDKGKLRLDANEAYGWRELEPWIDNFAYNDCIEFMEQPFSRPMTVRHFADLVTTHAIFPLALDESIQSPGDWQHILVDDSWPGYAVIKPSLFGSYSECQQAINGFQDRVVISSAIESPVGARALAVLASEANVKPAVGMGVAGLMTDQGAAPAEIVESTYEQESSVWQRY